MLTLVAAPRQHAANVAQCPDTHDAQANQDDCEHDADTRRNQPNHFEIHSRSPPNCSLKIRLNARQSFDSLNRECDVQTTEKQTAPGREEYHPPVSGSSRPDSKMPNMLNVTWMAKRNLASEYGHQWRFEKHQPSPISKSRVPEAAA
jgi:hypothetical protein